ncbi:aromatic acid/H+ symport family MFS transporter [Actinomadura graeca]|uniref:Aromatic acid/H+ symport family MFS transporter n=1 Tax=Actinomadura graeca TaxID=2750812 RepID=A0ABX8QRZ0_9ACTN|nr:aromatic acid/H+ symport family MFS transporter [Actinomadura graeca]QXJ20974.1 aromatic acid/H+ symport family MFS transporter [Actinomadura graeca]
MAFDDPGPERARGARRVLAICWATVVFDGYDLITYGTVVPSLLRHRAWDLTAAEVGRIGSLALAGMLVGALVVGTLTDLVGRRRIMLCCLVWFSVAMPLTGLAPDPWTFGLLRFVTGLGLGGVVPTAIALTIEYAPAARRQLYNALMFSGYSAGGVLAALTALVVLPSAGFRVMFFLGAAPLVLVVPAAYKLLPESVAYLAARRGAGTAAAPRAGAPFGTRGFESIRCLFSRRNLPKTLLFWLISLIGLLLVYGLNTWLPELMRDNGYSMGSSLTFLLVFNAGAVAGVIAAAALADRVGERAVVCGAFAVAAVSVLLFATRPSVAPLLALTAVAGFGANSQTMVNALVGGHYPPAARATALGWALAVGRIGAIIGPVFGGLVVTAVQDGVLGPNWHFYAFAIPAVIAAGLVLLVPRRRAVDAVAVPMPHHRRASEG